MGTKAWSKEEEQKLCALYIEKEQDVDFLADYFNKARRSIISKLVNLGIYKKPNSKKDNIRTVKTMLRDLETMLNIEIEGFNLNKKNNLLCLVESIEKIKGINNANRN